MKINSANLDALRVGFKSSFQGALDQAPSDYLQIATVVPSSTKEQTYGWLGKIPNVREWVGPRAVQNIAEHDYSIKEKAWELTIGVDRDDIETDNLGIYGPLFAQMGQSAGATYDRKIFGLLAAGASTLCYDGQNFFDTDHPVLDANGAVTTVSNKSGNTGTWWYLLCTSEALKPLILQKRRDFTFVYKDRPEDDNVFSNNEFVYGCDARFNVGFGFWQMAYAFQGDLNATNYATVRAALTGMKGDYGNPLGLKPNLLVVPSSLEGDARKLLLNDFDTAGATNPWKGSAELLVTPWLS